MHSWITILFGITVDLIETMRSGLDPVPYLKGQGYTRYLKVRVHMLVSALLLT